MTNAPKRMTVNQPPSHLTNKVNLLEKRDSARHVSIDIPSKMTPAGAFDDEDVNEETIVESPPLHSPTLLSSANSSFASVSTASTASSFRSRTNSSVDYVDYLAVLKRKDGETWTHAGLDVCRQLLREMENRNPTFYGFKVTDPISFTRNATREVIENHLRILHKHYKTAAKKKSPQSAWRPVYASLEGLTLFLRDPTSSSSPMIPQSPLHANACSWYDPTTLSSDTHAQYIMKSVGCAWVSLANRLVGLGSFSASVYPSVRTVVHVAMKLGHDWNEQAGLVLSDWPEKLESLWTGTVFEGDAAKKRNDDMDNMDTTKSKKKAKKLLAKSGGGSNTSIAASDNNMNGLKPVKKLGRRKEQALADPWDFKESLNVLKGTERKSIGGVVYDISAWGAEERARFVAGGHK